MECQFCSRVSSEILVTTCNCVTCFECLRRHFNRLVRMTRTQPLYCQGCRTFLDPAKCLPAVEQDPVLWNTLQSYIASAANRHKRLHILQPLVPNQNKLQLQIIPYCPPSSTASQSRSLTTKPYTTAQGAVECVYEGRTTIGCWVCYDHFRASRGFVSTHCLHAVCGPCIRRYLFRIAQKKEEFPPLCPFCPIPIDLLHCLKLARPNSVLYDMVNVYFEAHGFDACSFAKQAVKENTSKVQLKCYDFTPVKDPYPTQSKMVTSPVTPLSDDKSDESRSTVSIKSVTNLPVKLGAIERQQEEGYTELDSARTATPPKPNAIQRMDSVSTITMSSRLKKMQCPICQEAFSSMKPLLTTNCGHMFCTECLRTHIKVTVREQKEYPPHCPYCREGLDIKDCGLLVEDDVELRDSFKSYVALNEHYNRITAAPSLSWLT